MVPAMWGKKPKDNMEIKRQVTKHYFWNSFKTKTNTARRQEQPARDKISPQWTKSGKGVTAQQQRMNQAKLPK